jgi:uncharacterized membrane protein YfcA
MQPIVTPDNLLWLLLSGTAAGCLGAMLGVGGGIILVPLLVLVFHVPIHYAIGTSIITVIATSSMAGSFQLDRGTVNIRLGMLLEVATALGGLGGGILAGLVPGRVLTITFGSILAPVGFLMWRKGREQPDRRSSGETAYELKRLPLAMGLSLGAGTISGLLGIGGGIIKVPALTLWCNVPTRIATATSTFMIGVTAVASAFLYFGRGQVRPALSAVVILGVLGGSALGTQAGKRIRGHHLIRIFAALVWFSAIQMLFRGIQGGGR